MVVLGYQRLHVGSRHLDGLVLQEEEMVVDEHAAQEQTADAPGVEGDHSRDIYTLANIITVLRLVLVPFFFAVLLSERSDVLAFLIFALAASTDWLDGQIARRTGTVTEIGKAIDPLVDRLLIASGVIGVYLLGRIPLWTVLVLVARDVYLLSGAAYLARHGIKSLPVSRIGKWTTALLLIGFSGLILNWPMMPGLGIVESPQLPGWGSEPAALGIWFVYAGIVTSVLTAIGYTAAARQAIARTRTE
jgi:cardiolipin synthase